MKYKQPVSVFKYLVFLTLFLQLTFNGLLYAQLTGPVSISVSNNPTSKEVIAAREARRFLYLRTDSLINIKSQNWNDIPADENVILIGSLTSTTVQQILTAKSIASPTLGVEDFYLKTITDGPRKVTLVAGYDETATLRGAYKLMELFGVRYSHDGDIVAEGTITLDFPAIDKVYTPNFAIRGMLPYHSWNPEGPEYWSTEYYKSFLTQQFKMGQNFLGLVHDYNVSDTRAWVWSPTNPDNSDMENQWAYELQCNIPAAGASQVFAGSIFTSPRRIEARKISNVAQRRAFTRQANLDFLKDVYGYANTIGIKTAYGSESGGGTGYYVNFFNNLKTFNPDFYWLMTKEYWTWGYGAVTDQDYIWIKENLNNAHSAKATTGASFRIGTTGWLLGPPLTPGAQTDLSKHLPEDAFISCQTPSVGRNPVQPEWAQITKQKDKWIIPWLEDDFSVTNQQLWVDRTITQARDGKTYGCNGLIGVHWNTKKITPQSMVLAQLGWDATITKDSFWDDFCLIHFGSEVASQAAAIFKSQDGNMARVTNWIENWPGTLVTGTWNFSYVDQFAALRPNVVGASNLERFDYYLNIFKYNRALGALGNNKNNAALYRDVMNVLLPAVYTSSEIGNIISIARQVGNNVAQNYTGTPHLAVLTPRANLLPTEDLILDIYFIESGTPQKVELFWKPIGGETFTSVTAVRQSNTNHFKINIPANTLSGADFEYYIKGITSGGTEQFAPKSAPTRNFTVVQMAGLTLSGSSPFTEAETNYTVVAEAGSNGSIAAESSIACSNNQYLSLPDAGDEAKIAFNVTSDGDYNVFIRIKSGETNAVTSLIQNYEIKINNVAKTTALVEGSVTTIADVDSYYGTLKSEPVALTAGVNYVSIKALADWLRVDYVQALLVPDTQSPTAPTNLFSSDITTTGVTLTWTASTDNVGVVGYDVYRGNTLVGTTSGNSLVITGLAPNTTSSFTVVAKDAAGNVSAASSPLSVTTIDADVVINKTNSAPVIDGVKDAIWGNEHQTIGNITVGSVTNAADLSATWTSLWDNQNLYIFIEIIDDVIKVDSGTTWWEDDRIEVFIDAVFSRSTSYGPKQYQYYIRPAETALKEIKLNALANTQVAYVAVTGGYNIEMKIPFTTLGVTPVIDLKMGIDVQVGDDDDGGGVDAKIAWYATIDNTWQNPSLLGVAKLVSGPLSNGDENSLINDLQIFPNPAKTNINVYNIPSNSKLVMYNIQGISVFEIYAPDKNLTIDAEKWPGGIYFLQISQESGLQLNRKIIIQ